MRTLSIVLTSALLLVACDWRPADRPPAPAAVAAPTVAPTPAVTPVAGLSGAFDAISNTAMGVTGNLTADGQGLKFAQGQAYRVTGVSTLEAVAPYAATGASFADLINVPETAKLSVFKVDGENPGKAVNGGFCGKIPTTYLVTHRGVDGSGAPALFIVAFNGAAAPGANSAETELCGTFMYAPNAG